MSMLHRLALLLVCCLLCGRTVVAGPAADDAASGANGAGSNDAWHAPLVLAVESVAEIEPADDDATRRRAMLLVIVAERLASVPGVRVVSPDRTTAILRELRGGSRSVRETEWVTTCRASLALDALLTAAVVDGQVTLRLHRADGSVEVWPLVGDSLIDQVQGVLRQLATTLDLPPGLADLPTRDPAVLRAVSSTRLLNVQWPANSGETRLRALQPLWSNAPSSVTGDAARLAAARDRALVAAEVVDAATLLVSSSRREQTFAKPGLDMARLALPTALATGDDEIAAGLVHATSGGFEADVLALVAPLRQRARNGGLDIDIGDVLNGGPSAIDTMSAETGLTSAAGDAASPAAQLAGVRLLGDLGTAAALTALQELAGNGSPAVRQAVADGLGRLRPLPLTPPRGPKPLPADAGLKTLAALVGDADPGVAFMAARALARRRQPSPTLAALARRALAAPPATAPTNTLSPAVLTLARLAVLDQAATATDADAVAAGLADDAPAVRAAAVRAATRLGVATPTQQVAWLRDADNAVVHAALAGVGTLPARSSEDPRIATTILLARDPAPDLANAARQALQPHRPPGSLHDLITPAPATATAPGTTASALDPAAVRFALAVEHPYTCRRLLDRLAADPTSANLDLLVEATANTEPHVAVDALIRYARLTGEADGTPLAPPLVPSPVAAANPRPAAFLPVLPPGARPSAAALALDRLASPYVWVRLHAAALLATTAPATPEAIATLTRARAAERDPAIQLYLDDARAHAAGEPPPARPPAARSIADRPHLTWLFGYGADAASPASPFGAYYVGNVAVTPAWKDAYAVGKLFMGRAETVGQPGLAILSRRWQDQFWLSFNGQFGPQNLPWLDGTILGEETMSLAPDTLWGEGWQLFCIDADLDPARVDGQLANLNPAEREAWRNWALDRSVDGFNEMYDYLKLRIGRLRPGFQVGTFLPEQGLNDGGDPLAAASWKFDVGGIYDYKGNSRLSAYDLVRRYRTLWPTRPVIWLSLGIGGYEMNPVYYHERLPTSPLLTRQTRAWTDSATAWMAGADPGFFSTWIFVDKDFKGGMGALRGVQINVEDIQPDSPKLRAGIEYTFRGVESTLETQALGQAKVQDEAPTLDADHTAAMVEELGFETLDAPTGKADIAEQIAGRKANMRRGFQFYREHVYTSARLWGSLPRRVYRPTTLAVRPGVSVWTREARQHPLIPALALVDEHDFLSNINQLPGLDLSAYRLIIVHSPGALTDATIAALTDWLRTTPGVLVVNGTLSGDNRAEAATAGDHDGHLSRDWPWEADVVTAPPPALPKVAPRWSMVGPGVSWADTETLGFGAVAFLPAGDLAAALTITEGGHATVLLRGGPDDRKERKEATPSMPTDMPLLVLWRHPDFKGAVLFDALESAPRGYLGMLRGVLNDLQTREDLGLQLDAPFYQVRSEGASAANSATPETAAPSIRVAAASGAFASDAGSGVLPGVDALSGELDPLVGPGRSAALVAASPDGVVTTPFWIQRDGLSALGHAPLTGVATTADGTITLRCDALVELRGVAGRPLTVSRADGTALPTIPPAESADWLALATTDGAYLWTPREGRRSVLFVRSASPITVRVGAVPPPAVP